MFSGAGRRERLLAIDAARGIALLLMVLSHFGSTYFRTADTQRWAAILVAIGMVATPTFVVVSGFLAGFLYRSADDQFVQIRLRMIDRGFFLLVVVHGLVTLALFPTHHAIMISMSTDAIGMALIAGPLMIPHVKGRTRLALGAAAYVFSWLVAVSWAPTGPAMVFIEKITLGNLAQPTFPMVPWFGVYLASSVYGETFATRHRGPGRPSAYGLGIAGMVMIVVVLMTKLLTITALLNPKTALAAEKLHNVFRIGQKGPPGPGYLLFYGGSALCLLTLCLNWERWGLHRRWLAAAAAWGQASLAIFVVNFYVFWLAVYYFTPSSLLLAPLYLAGAIVLLTWVALAWRRWEGNRFTTVGVGPLTEAALLTRKRWTLSPT
ncbi:MAG TPA: heparan-alpha-glucosaminide N-acetyltransferase domain-containing protein [Vicinamibacterales bacterium]|jgi:uncharacterized membrane protein